MFDIPYRDVFDTARTQCGAAKYDGRIIRERRTIFILRHILECQWVDLFYRSAFGFLIFQIGSPAEYF